MKVLPGQRSLAEATPCESGDPVESPESLREEVGGEEESVLRVYS